MPTVSARITDFPLDKRFARGFARRGRRKCSGARLQMRNRRSWKQMLFVGFDILDGFFLSTVNRLYGCWN